VATWQPPSEQKGGWQHSWSGCFAEGQMTWEDSQPHAGRGSTYCFRPPKSSDREGVINVSRAFRHTQTTHGSLKDIYLKTEQKSFGILKPNNHPSLES
jgi:hypothetical protein